jgi:diguanylate cyclase (GGDEF)-like protein
MTVSVKGVCDRFTAIQKLVWVFGMVVGDLDQGKTIALERENSFLRTEVARLKAQLEAMEVIADTDGLTGLLNRRAFVRELERAISAHERYGFSTALVYADVRGLKKINDTLGHAAGDDALCHVAGALAGGIRTTDSVGRLGGDEFGVILSHLEEGTARERLSSIARVVQFAPLACDGADIAVRLRFGMTMLVSGDSARAALTRADLAMYASGGAQRSER